MVFGVPEHDDHQLRLDDFSNCTAFHAVLDMASKYSFDIVQFWKVWPPLPVFHA